MMNKKILYFICGLSLSMTIFMVIDSYGLFESKNVLNVDSNIAKWNVFINGTDIKKNETSVSKNDSNSNKDSNNKNKDNTISNNTTVKK